MPSLLLFTISASKLEPHTSSLQFVSRPPTREAIGCYVLTIIPLSDLGKGFFLGKEKKAFIANDENRVYLPGCCYSGREVMVSVMEFLRHREGSLNVILVRKTGAQL